MLKLFIFLFLVTSMTKGFIYFPPASCIGRRNTHCDEMFIGRLMLESCIFCT